MFDSAIYCKSKCDALFICVRQSSKNSLIYLFVNFFDTIEISHDTSFFYIDSIFFSFVIISTVTKKAMICRENSCIHLFVSNAIVFMLLCQFVFEWKWLENMQNKVFRLNSSKQLKN